MYFATFNSASLSNGYSENPSSMNQFSQNQRLQEMSRGNYELSAKSVGRTSIVQSTPEEIMQNSSEDGDNHHQVKIKANVH